MSKPSKDDAEACVQYECAVTGVKSLDDWPLKASNSGCACCDSSPAVRCGALVPGGITGWPCDVELNVTSDEFTISQLCNSLTRHLCAVTHIHVDYIPGTGWVQGPKFTQVRRRGNSAK